MAEPELEKLREQFGAEERAIALAIIYDSATVAARKVNGEDVSRAERHLAAQRANLKAAAQVIVANTVNAVLGKAGRALLEIVKALAAGVVAGAVGGA